MANRSRGRRADYLWASVCGVANDVDNAEGVRAIGTGSFVVGELLTIVRSHGLFTAQLDPTAVNERVMAAFGVIKVSNEAFAAGIASIPSPNADADAEWIVHGYLWVTSGQEAAIVPDGLFDRVRIDSKAMRKAKPSDTLAVAFEICSSQDQGGTVDFTYGLRILSAS